MTAFKITIYMIFLIFSSSVFSSPMTLTPQGPGGGFIFVPCTLDSHDVECLLDTGSYISRIKKDNFSEAYTSLGKVTTTGMSGVPKECDMIKIEKLILGDVIAKSQKFIRCPEDDTGINPIFSGNIVGLTSFIGKTIHLDFKNLNFSLNDSIPNSLTTEALKVYQSGHFGFKANISDGEIESIIDTGAAFTTIDQSLVDASPENFQYIQDLPGGTDVNGNAIFFKFYRMKQVSFGRLNLNNILVFAADFSAVAKIGPGIKLILGFNVITQKNWYFDLDKKLWSSY